MRDFAGRNPAAALSSDIPWPKSMCPENKWPLSQGRRCRRRGRTTDGGGQLSWLWHAYSIIAGRECPGRFQPTSGISVPGLRMQSACRVLAGIVRAKGPFTSLAPKTASGPSAQMAAIAAKRLAGSSVLLRSWSSSFRSSGSSSSQNSAQGAAELSRVRV